MKTSILILIYKFHNNYRNIFYVKECINIINGASKNVYVLIWFQKYIFLRGPKNFIKIKICGNLKKQLSSN